METITQCPLCSGNQFGNHFAVQDFTVSHETFIIQECRKCQFRITSPRPSQQEIGSYYQSESYISHAPKAITFKDHVYHLIRRRAIRAKHKLVAKYQAQGNALDLGCGTGEFLAYLAQQGYDTIGVEVSASARTVARSKGLHVEADLRSVSAKNLFNLVTLWHVLEHLPDPTNALVEIHSRMHPGAYVVVAVPNRTSWDATHYGDAWAAWDVPRHLSHFRREDLNQLLENTGFNVIENRNMWYDAPYVAMLSEQYRGSNPTIAFLKGGLIGLYSNLITLVENRSASSILLVAQKPNMPAKARNS